MDPDFPVIYAVPPAKCAANLQAALNSHPRVLVARLRAMDHYELLQLRDTIEAATYLAPERRTAILVAIQAVVP